MNKQRKIFQEVFVSRLSLLQGSPFGSGTSFADPPCDVHGECKRLNMNKSRKGGKMSVRQRQGHWNGRHRSLDGEVLSLHAYLLTYLPTYLLTYLRSYLLGTYLPTYLHTYIPTYIHTYTHTYIHTYIHTYVRTYVRTYVHAHTYIHTYIHTYMHACMHAYLLTHFNMS